MTENDGKTELYKKYRPRKLSDLVGQDDAVRTLKEFGRKGNLPHFLLLTGPSGTGKTTTARILQRLLRCSDLDFTELNCAADARGIDTVREIKQRMGSAPLGGDARIYLLDEAHRLTSDSMGALLKMLEDTPVHVWFMLATTDPQKLIPTIRTRATEVKFKPLRDRDMEGLLADVAGKEGIELSEEVRDKIVASAEGSPRKALVLLNQVMGIGDEQGRLAAVSIGLANAQTIDLCRLLLNPKSRWPAVAKLLRELQDEPESVRRAVIGYHHTLNWNVATLFRKHQRSPG